MLFSSDYSVKMPLGEALAVSLIGIVTVIIILAVIACLIILVSKIIRGIEEKSSASSAVKSAPVGESPAIQGVTEGSVELIDTDEKTAAVIMAIVSEKSGIPLNRLSFKSIKLIKEEGGEEK